MVSQFLMEWEDEASEMCYQSNTATWNYITNLTEFNKNKMVRWCQSLDRVSLKKIGVLCGRFCMDMCPSGGSLFHMFLALKNKEKFNFVY